MEFKPGALMIGIPHTPGSREYLTCERGRMQISIGGQTWTLAPGDVVVFRGDQKHGYRNVASSTSVAYGVISFALAGA
jgi:quercetin dioxygenase-like cupin family protein